MAEGSPRSATDAVRITVEEAGVLQGFRPDYPWHGSRSRCFLQIGNAVCPPLARLVVAAAAGHDLDHPEGRSPNSSTLRNCVRVEVRNGVRVEVRNGVRIPISRSAPGPASGLTPRRCRFADFYSPAENR